MVIIQVQTNMYIDEKNLNHPDIQSFLNDIKTGSFQREIKRDDLINKMTATYHIIKKK